MIRLVYATGPVFTDVQSNLSMVVGHLFIFYGMGKMTSVLHSSETRRMLDALSGATSVELGAPQTP